MSERDVAVAKMEIHVVQVVDINVARISLYLSNQVHKMKTATVTTRQVIQVTVNRLSEDKIQAEVVTEDFSDLLIELPGVLLTSIFVSVTYNFCISCISIIILSSTTPSLTFHDPS